MTIVSHRYRYIFLKTAKTGGTSVEIALSRHCGPEDVVTPLYPPDEWLRRQLGGVGCQNCWRQYRGLGFRGYARMGKRALRSAQSRVLRRPEIHYIRPLRFTEHMTAARVQGRLPRAVWDSYLKFCIVRNPWDRVVSYYYYHLREGRIAEPLTQWLKGEALGNRSSLDIYMIENELAVDRVIRFENLDRELREIAEELGVPAMGPLPRAKSQFRPDAADVSTTLSNEDANRIGAIFEREIELFGYRPPEVRPA